MASEVLPALVAPEERAGIGRAPRAVSAESSELSAEKKNVVVEIFAPPAPVFAVTSVMGIVAPMAAAAGALNEATTKSGVDVWDLTVAPALAEVFPQPS